MLKFKNASSSPRPKQKVTRVAFVLDVSGSMQTHKKGAVETYNTAIKVMQESVRKHVDEAGLPQDATMSLFTFSDSSRIRIAFSSRGIASILPLHIDDDVMACGGNTALLDASLKAIAHLDDIPEGLNEDVAYLVYVITDGEENNSSFGSKEKLQSLVQAKLGTDKWTICYMVPKGYGSKFAMTSGIPDGNVAEWDTLDASGMTDVGQRTQKSLDAYFSGRSTGAKATRSFFVDVDRLAPSVVKHTLTNVKDDFIALSVPSDSRLDDFVKSCRLPFEKGRSYYQLTPDRSNKVQPDKEILIRERGKTAIYAGAEARRLIGLPLDKQVTVRPGKLGNYEVFVQSKSDNRKLTKGSILLYKRT